MAARFPHSVRGRRCLLDTSAYFALFNRSDERHGDASEIADLIAAERLRAVVENLQVTFERVSIPVTTSIGVATLVSGQQASAQALVQAADQCLYRAKERGRNRVESTIWSG